MPLKKVTASTQTLPAAVSPALKDAQVPATEQTATPKKLGGVHKAGDRDAAPMTKDDYWRRREERDVQRDKDMAWSGIAQAVIQSVAAAQLNLDNTEDGLVALVTRITSKLLQARAGQK